MTYNWDPVNAYHEVFDPEGSFARQGRRAINSPGYETTPDESGWLLPIGQGHKPHLWGTVS